MRTYEITYLTTKEEGHDAATIAPLLTEQKAKIVRVHPWGTRRKLAYPIKKEDQAFITTVVFEADPSVIAPLERAVQLQSEILRGLIVHYEPGVFDRTPVTEEAPAAKPIEAPKVKATAVEEKPAEAAKAAATEPAEAQPAKAEAETDDAAAEAKPKRKRTTKKATDEEAKALDEKLSELLNEDITR